MRVHNSQAYSKMDVTRERIEMDVTREPREILLSFQTGFNLVNAAGVCAIPESFSGLEPSSIITEEGSKTEILSRIPQITAALTRLQLDHRKTS